MKKLLFCVIILLYFWWLTPWFFCGGFKEPFHFSVYSLQLNLNNLIHNDTGLPFTLIRFYHNKMAFFVITLLSSLLRFWDITFLVNLVSIMGIFGLFYGFLTFSKEIFSKPFLKILIIFMIILPLVETLFRPQIYFPAKIIFISLPFEIFSLLGTAKFLAVHRGKKEFFFIISLLWFSVWRYTVLPWESLNFCQ